MNTLSDIYGAMVGRDMEKSASHQQEYAQVPSFSDDLVKQASGYDAAGRRMAQQAFGQMIKQAVDEAAPDASEEDKADAVSDLLAKANGEKSEDEDESEDKDEDEDESEDKDEESESDDEDKSEKKASVYNAILEKMAGDPEYVSYLIAKHLNQ